MSLLQWFRRTSTAVANATVPTHSQPATSPPRTQRQDHRQHVYQVVREVMLRSEILAASYSFKVLTLDREGRQFVVMIDVRDPRIVHRDIMGDLERRIADNAQSQHNLHIKSVYWRCTAPPTNNEVGMTTASRLATSTHAARHNATGSMDVGTATSATGHAASAPPATAAPNVGAATAPTTPQPSALRDPARTGTFFEPIGTDEIRAFKQALDPGQTSSGLRKTPDPKKKRPTGFEDTELLEDHDPPSPLSNTQYGDL